MIGFYLPGRFETLEAAEAATALNAWIRISTDESVTIVIDKSEMGQGILTALCMLAAEELECDWKSIHTEFADAAEIYYNPAFRSQGTGGSSSVRSSWEPMRKAGATAREMLLEAAAQKWGVEKSTCKAVDGAVLHQDTNRRLTFGSLAESAGKLPAPQNVPLKDSKNFHTIGKPTKRLDTAVKVNGSAQFGIDVRRPGMVYAVVERCPVFGGKVASFDATKAMSVPGVKKVVEISNGVAVVADNTWTAMQGRRALEIRWDEGPNANLNSEGIRNLFAARTSHPGVVARKDGDAAAALSSAAQKIEAVVRSPLSVARPDGTSELHRGRSRGLL